MQPETVNHIINYAILAFAAFCVFAIPGYFVFRYIRDDFRSAREIAFRPIRKGRKS